MLQQFGDPQAVLAAAATGGAALAALVPAPTLAYLRDPDPAPVEADLAWLAQPENHCLCLTDANYPPLLREIDQPPPLLFVRGSPALLRESQLAIVGTRRPTASGARTARDFAHFLATRGAVITSGLALGIDGEAHRGALASGAAGTTVAVLGCGLDTVYPARHAELAETILAQGGAIVSELAPGSPPAAEHFPRRNRIIAGLSLGTLVVEAALRSGSLITARLAAEQGREVFAIPGSIHNPMSKGCHALIREGAKLVETADDIIAELAAIATAANALNLPLSETNEQAGAAAAGGDAGHDEALDADYSRLLACMDAGAGGNSVSVDSLVEQSGLTVEAVSSMLLILELKGLVKASAGGFFSRLQPRNGA